MGRTIRAIFVLILILFAGVLLLFLGKNDRVADKGWMARRHINQSLYYSLGHQLPGTPDLERLSGRLAEKSLKLGDPVFFRIFKSELKLELWMKRKDRFIHFATYPICYWSGRLGPKLKEGDRQAPEGFYTVSRSQLNPNSRWHRSFNLGFPNLYDRAQGRTGSFLMVHGGCSSIGCYAVTDRVIGEIWDLINAAFDGGQKRFAVHVFPFRLTDARLDAYKDHRWAGFWRELKPGYDAFEQAHIPPEVSVCEGKYAVQNGISGTEDVPGLSNFCPSIDETAAQS